MNNLNEGPMKSGGIKSNSGIPRPAQNPGPTSTSNIDIHQKVENIEGMIKVSFDIKLLES